MPDSSEETEVNEIAEKIAQDVAVQRLKRIRLLSGPLAWVCIGVSVFLPLWTVYAWMSLPANEIIEEAVEIPALIRDGVAAAQLDSMKRIIGAAVALFGVGAFSWGLWRLGTLFRLYRSGQIFTMGNVSAMKAAATSFVLAATFTIIETPFLSLLLTFDFAPGERLFIFQFDEDEIYTLIAAGGAFIISWVMAECQRLSEENAYFV